MFLHFRKKKMKKLTVLISALVFSLSIVSAKPQFSMSLDIIGLTMSGDDLAKEGYSWADKERLEQVPLIPLALPAFTLCYGQPAPHNSHEAEDEKKEPEFQLLSTEFFISSTISLLDARANCEFSIYLTPLLQLTASSGIHSAWNYSSSNPSLGVYNPAKAEYDKLTSFSEFAYNFAGKATVTIPLPQAIILQGSYEHKYVAFTGADDKEPWKCGESGGVNGWKYQASVMIGKMFECPKLKMIGLIGSAEAWYSDSYFDERYKDYNPDFIEFSIVPMVQFELTKKQSLMAQAVISRDRKFENDDCDNDQQLLQVYDGTKWRLKTIMAIWHIDL